MKKLLLLVISFTIQYYSHSQANVVSGSISIQGIARDANNNALVNTTLPIAAELYYLNSNTPVSIELRTGQVTTDGFGVFAYVMEISATSFTKISNTEAFIKISSGSTKFADEKLRMVPYAVHAQNGVPSGTILPFAGTTVPEGWMLCDGRTIPNEVFYNSLRSVLGNATNVPDLRGMFLRGAGTNSSATYANNVGPALRAVQADAAGPHNHPQQGTLTTNTTGLHQHTFYAWQGGTTPHTTSGAAIKTTIENPATGSDDAPYSTDGQGNHSHTVTLTGNTANNTGTETRPVNFGVNFIIKI